MKKVTSIALSSAIMIPGLLAPFTVSAATIPTTNDNSTVIETKAATDAAIPKEENLQGIMEKAKISKEKAIEIAKSFYSIPADFKQESIRFQTDWYVGSNSVWIIDWNKNSEEFNSRYTAVINANNGDVIEYNYYLNHYNPKYTYPPKIKWSDAKEKATEFIKKNFPEKLNHVMYDDFYEKNEKTPLNGNVMFNVNFHRVENGIKFQDNLITVLYDSDGNFAGFTYRWNNELSFPTKEGMLSKDEALKKMKETIPLDLQYQTMYERTRVAAPSGNQDKKTIALTYQNNSYYPFFNAKTGEWVNFNGEASPKAVGYEALSKEVIAEKPPVLNKELKAEEGIAIIKKYFQIPSDLSLENVSLDENSFTEFTSIWRYNWTNKTKNYWMSASVDAKTGEIINFYKESYMYREVDNNDANKNFISYEDARKAAIDIVKTVVPHKFHQLVEMKDPNINLNQKSEQYYFTFNRANDGIIVPDQWVSISISGKDKDVTRFDQHWEYNTVFPDAKKAIEKEAAVTKYLEQFELDANYKLLYEKMYHTTSQPSAKEPLEHMELVYELRQKPFIDSIYLDAILGEWAYARTGELVKDQVVAKDINGHWAQKELQLLIDYNAIEVDKDGLVHPSKSITRGEMIKMFMLTTNPEPYFYKMQSEISGKQATFLDVTNSSKYFPYVELAVQQGLIDASSKNFNPNELVSREEMAVLVVKALNLYEFSKINSLFNLDFKDAANIKEKGVASIVKHLNIMVGTDGYFNPEKSVSKAEAAKIFYQYLKHRGQYNK